MRTLLPTLLLASWASWMGCAGGAGDDPQRDLKQRATLVEGKGWSWVGFIPVAQRGDDGEVRITPRHVSRHQGAVQAVVEYAIKAAQGPGGGLIAGRFSPELQLEAAPRLETPALAAGMSIVSARSEYGYGDGQIWGVAWWGIATGAAGTGGHFAWQPPGGLVRQAGGGSGHWPAYLALDPGQRPAYAFRRGAAIGVARYNDNQAFDLREIPAEADGPVGLMFDGANPLVVTAAATGMGDTLLQVWSTEPSFQPAAAHTVANGWRAGELRTLAAGGRFYVAGGTGEAPEVYGFDGMELSRMVRPTGTRITVGVDAGGALLYGFIDAKAGSSVVRVENGALVPVGQAGFSLTPAAVYPFSDADKNIYAAIAVADPAGVTIACNGASCPAAP